MIKNIIILLITTGIVKSLVLNRTILIEHYGYSTDSIYIDLSNNSLDLIDSATFHSFNKLEVLYLDENKISKLDYGLFNNLKSLRQLWLESNSLIDVNRKSFVGLNSLELVCLSNNPISNLFPNYLVSLCETNIKCVVKVFEKCQRNNTSIQITTPQTDTTTSIEESIILI